MPCNYFQSWENDWDEFHVVWTHRTGAIHTPPSPTPSEKTVEEVDWGVLKRARKADGTGRVTGYFMPHTLRLVIPSPNLFSYRKIGPAYRDTYIMHVPVDDESHRFFMVGEIRVEGADVDLYYETYAEWCAQTSDESEQKIGNDIVAGRSRLEEFLDHPNLVALEDYAAQVGQGAIADRSLERLSRTDADVVMMRRIYSREMKAIAEGTPVKSWTTLAEMVGMDVTEAVLANSGTGARSAVSV
jgi:5,5'-dehydrodivanillate O-demethylase